MKAGTFRFAIVAVAVGVLSATPPALGQGGDARQAARLTFDQQRPGETTGTRLAIDYVNAENADAKPRAVQKVVLEFAPGTVIDTSVPARCEASNAALMASGPSACPAESRVGGGQLDLDTGAAGPGRILANEVTMLNNTGELILLLESKSEPGSRIVARGVISGATLTTEVSPVPGGPPDGFTAIKRVRLALEPRATGSGADARSYIATPPSCPPERAWKNKLTFTYRDGVSQTVVHSSPCTDGTRPPVECQRPGRISFQLHRRQGTRVVEVAAYVNRKLWLRRSGRDVGRVTLSGLPRSGRMGVRIVATHSTGSKVVSSRAWSGCKKGRPRIRVVRSGRR